MASNKEEKADRTRFNGKEDLYHDIEEEKKKKLERW